MRPTAPDRCFPAWIPIWLWGATFLSVSPLRGYAGTAPQLDEAKLPPPATNQVDFARDIRPLIEGHCYKCHAGDKPRSNFRLTSRETALKGGTQGTDLVPGRSAKSPLIYYVARLIPDMEMPPEGRGTPLTTEEVALLRAWIDQGLEWVPGQRESPALLTISPVFGGTAVSGDQHKFREVTRQPAGWNGGLDDFLVEQHPNPDTRITAAGHALRDDYKLTLSAQRNDLGFARFGWTQFRTYYDGTGGYDPQFLPAPLQLHNDLFLDTGRAWADFGLTLPRGPRIEVGYEYQYRRGEKSTLQWGPVSNGTDLRAIFPAAEDISEKVHVLKFKAEYEALGILLSDDFRGEWYHLERDRQNDISYAASSGAIALTKADEKASYFHGANVFHAEKQFTDWLFAGGGYLYSKLTSDASMDVQTLNIVALDPALAAPGWHSPRIDLKRESNVFSLSALLRPWQNLSLSLGVQNEWTRQEGIGAAEVDLAVPFDPYLITNIPPQQLSSSLDRAVFSQNCGLRFTGIPFTALFAEARFQQEDIGQYQEEDGGLTPFLLRADESRRLQDFRLGFNTSPWRRAEFSGELRRFDQHNDYNNSLQEIQGHPFQAYPGFMRSREVLSDQAQGRITLSLAPWVKAALMYQWINRKYHTATEEVDDPGPPVVTGGFASGANLLAGTYQAHIPSVNLTFTPARRLFLSTTFAYQNARTATADNGSPSVVPYQGNVYSAIASGSYVLGPKTDLVAGYSFSAADFSEKQPQDGLPLGIKYQQHSAQVGIKHQFTRSTAASLQYRFYHYDEPSSGGFNNFNAHAVFATVTLTLR
ncbi:MAG TPA: c-type cytochrome domain-containing protein [Verrucomicrobiae bacterium]